MNQVATGAATVTERLEQMPGFSQTARSRARLELRAAAVLLTFSLRRPLAGTEVISYPFRWSPDGVTGPSYVRELELIEPGTDQSREG